MDAHVGNWDVFFNAILSLSTRWRKTPLNGQRPFVNYVHCANPLLTTRWQTIPTYYLIYGSLSLSAAFGGTNELEEVYLKTKSQFQTKDIHYNEIISITL